MEVERDCSTPKDEEHKIPAALVCPPPPTKKREPPRKAEPSPDAYFRSPELEKFLVGANRSRN